MSKYVESTVVAEYLGFDVDNYALISQIDLALEIVEDLIEEYCNTSFVQQDALTMYLDGKGLGILTPPLYIRAITSIEEVDLEGDVISSLTTFRLMPSASYRTVYKWIELPSGVFSPGIHNYKVIGDFGLEDIPKAVVYAIVETVKHFFQLRDFNDLISMESNISRTLALKGKVHYLPQHARQMLDKWKFTPIAWAETNVNFNTR